MGDIVIFAKLSVEMNAGSSPLRMVRVRSLEEGSNGCIRSLTLECKAKPSQNYQSTIRSPDKVTVVAKVEKMVDCVDSELPASDSTRVPQEVEDEFESEASAAVYWRSQMMARTGKLG